MSSRTLFFVTSNAGKLAEVKSILSASGVNLESKSVEITEIQGTIEEIIKDKAKRAVEKIGSPVIVEDTCLCFNALKGLPGPYVKHFMKEIGTRGLTNMLSAYDDKTAQAVCTFAYCEPGKEPILFEGRTNGKIVRARGDGSFGWDPIFEYEGTTYAEMEPFKKNKISHRYKALQKLTAWLEEKHGGGAPPPPPPPATKPVDRRNMGGHDTTDEGGSFFDGFGEEVKSKAINIAGDGMGIRKATGREWQFDAPEGENRRY